MQRSIVDFEHFRGRLQDTLDRLSPIKKVTLPQLELLAALVGTLISEWRHLEIHCTTGSLVGRLLPDHSLGQLTELFYACDSASSLHGVQSGVEQGTESFRIQ
jgi:hypothetical protein